MSLSNALSYLTVLPIPFKKEIPLSESVFYFPLVGAAMGSLLLLVYLGLSLFLPPFVCAAAVVLLLEAMTGGIHLHGLTETADALFSFRPFSESLQNHRVGLVGMVTLFFVLLVKVQSIHYLPAEWKRYAVFLMPIVGRGAQVFGLLFCRHQMAGAAEGRIFSSRHRMRALGFTVAFLGFAFLFPAPMALLLLLQFVLGMALTYRFLNRRQGGLTVPTLSAAAELAETFFLFFAVVLARYFKAG